MAHIGIDATALPSEPVGAGTYIIQLVRALMTLETEHEWTIFTHRSRRQFFDLPDRTGWRWFEISDKSPAMRLAWEQTIFPMLVRQNNLDLLHSLHYTRPLILPCRSVVTFHDLTFFTHPHLHIMSKRLFFPPMMRFSARWADTLIADSESTRQDAICLLDIPSEKILTVLLGVREGFKPIQSPGILADTRKRYKLPERFILFVGTIEPRKNLPLLLKAYHNLPEQDNLPKLVIVGRKGWMYQQVFELVKSLKLENRVHFTGYIPDQDLPIVYNLAHVFVYPSNYEGFGLPPLEAMACGTPVITTAISSMPEHIGSAGILVPPGNEAALTQALHSVLNDSALRQNMTAQGLKRASHFTWKRTAQETLNAYQQALSTN